MKFDTLMTHFNDSYTEAILNNRKYFKVGKSEFGTHKGLIVRQLIIDIHNMLLNDYGMGINLLGATSQSNTNNKLGADFVFECEFYTIDTYDNNFIKTIVEKLFNISSIKEVKYVVKHNRYNYPDNFYKYEIGVMLKNESAP